MATQKPISTISYNTTSFLIEKLEELRAAHKIQGYMFIEHKGEDGDKDHKHVRVEPNIRLDPMDLTEYLREFQKGSDKPLGCMTWRNSEESDWILYAVHDPDYLAAKYGEDRCEKIPYEWTDIVASEGVDVETLYRRALGKNKKAAPGVLKQLRGGADPLDLVSMGANVHTVATVLSLMEKSTKAGLYRDLQDEQTKVRMIQNAVAAAGYEIGWNEDGEMAIIPVALSGEDVSASLPEDIDSYFS